MSHDVDMSAPRIERYLLGQLSADEQERIEARLFEDDDLFRTLEDVEEQLIDRYLAGELSPADRDSFEQQYARSRYRQERVAFRRILSDALASDASRRETPASDVAPARRESRRGLRTAIVAAATGLAAVLVVAFGWVIASRPPAPSPSTSPSSPSGGRMASPQGASPAPVVPLPDRGSTPSPGPSLVLRSGLLRATGVMPRLAAPGSGEVRFDAVLDASAGSGQTKAVLRRAEGETIWEGAAAIARNGRTASIIVPSSLLSPGDYILIVAPRGTTLDDAPAYAFRVVPGR